MIFVYPIVCFFESVDYGVIISPVSSLESLERNLGISIKTMHNSSVISKVLFRWIKLIDSFFYSKLHYLGLYVCILKEVFRQNLKFSNNAKNHLSSGLYDTCCNGLISFIYRTKIRSVSVFTPPRNEYMCEKNKTKE